MAVLLFISVSLRCFITWISLNKSNLFSSTCEMEIVNSLAGILPKSSLYNCLSVYSQYYQNWCPWGLVNFELRNLNLIFFYSGPISVFFGLPILEAWREKCP